MKLAYKAFHKTGREVQDVIDAASADEAAQKLRQQDLFVAEISLAEEPELLGHSRRAGGRVRSLQTLALLTRQLYSLVHSGMPLTQSLQSLERQTKDPRWNEVIRDVRVRVERGSQLSQALAAHPQYFDNIYTNMVAAGESSGQLVVILSRLADLIRKRAHVINRIRSAMTYPVLLVIIASTALTAMLLFVVPRFAELFGSLGTPLPPTTKALLCLSGVLRGYWWAVLLVLAAMVVAGRYYFLSPPGKELRDTVKLRMPRIGKIVKSFETARISRLLGILMESHLPIQDILRLTRCATSNCHYAALLQDAADSVDHGGSISAVFCKTNLISVSASEILHTGEQSGQVGPLLLELADFMDEENDTTLESLTSIIEPVMLVMMAAVVGFVAISIFLPLFDATGLVGGAH